MSDSSIIERTINCELCKPVDPKFLIYTDKNWHIELHGNQYYLGRCAIVYNRHLEDLFEIDTESREELFKLGKALQEAEIAAFHPDMFNYASLGNAERHLHLHFIPRYQNPTQFAGIQFIDERWGHNYSGYTKDFEVSDDVLVQIRDLLKQHLQMD